MAIVFTTAASFSRPSNTTAYAAGNLVANSTSAASVTPLAFAFPSQNISIRQATVQLAASATLNAKFKLHLYVTTPASIANGDGGAWSTGSTGWLDAIAVDCTQYAFADKAAGTGLYLSTATTSPMGLACASSNNTVYGLLTATAAYTPTANEVITVSLTADVS